MEEEGEKGAELGLEGVAEWGGGEQGDEEAGAVGVGVLRGDVGRAEERDAERLLQHGPCARRDALPRVL